MHDFIKSPILYQYKFPTVKTYLLVLQKSVTLWVWLDFNRYIQECYLINHPDLTTTYRVGRLVRWVALPFSILLTIYIYDLVCPFTTCARICWPLRPCRHSIDILYIKLRTARHVRITWESKYENQNSSIFS